MSVNKSQHRGSNSKQGMGDSGGTLLRQTLMNVDECFLYKLPPLASSGGHRAEQWDLSNPIQTCGFQVERRNNDLYLLFTTDQHTKLFALAKLHPDHPATKSVEPVMDSSRYFVVQIQQGGRGGVQQKSAYIGFGFRDRDIAIDLLGNLQQFRKSIEREEQAKHMHVTEIPKLGKGEKMHISLGHNNNRKSKSTSKKEKSNTANGTITSRPILLKKPPTADVVPVTPALNDTNNDDDAKTHPHVGPSQTSTVETPPIERLSIEDQDSEGKTSLNTGTDVVDDDDEWGDFEQA